jgi:energy-coupling factor transporter ATP-binding protein EcfA2
MTAILEARDVTMRFGGLVANERVSLSVRPGEIFAVIGPNGAGKTTLFNAITGIYEPTEGEVLFEGRPIRREWGMSDRVKGLAVGLVSAAVAVLALNASALWQGAIVDRYVYGEAFPWGEALDSVPRTLRESGFWLTWFAAAVGCRCPKDACGVGEHGGQHDRPRKESDRHDRRVIEDRAGVTFHR